MARRAARQDANHGAVRDALRAVGCSVLDLSGVGDGCPDLLVGIRGVTGLPSVLVLMEVKDGDKVPSKQKLTKAQNQFFMEWGEDFPLYTVNSVDAALQVVRGRKR